MSKLNINNKNNNNNGNTKLYNNNINNNYGNHSGNTEVDVEELQESDSDDMKPIRSNKIIKPKKLSKFNSLNDSDNFETKLENKASPQPVVPEETDSELKRKCIEYGVNFI